MEDVLAPVLAQQAQLQKAMAPVLAQQAALQKVVVAPVLAREAALQKVVAPVLAQQAALQKVVAVVHQANQRALTAVQQLQRERAYAASAAEATRAAQTGAPAPRAREVRPQRRSRSPGGGRADDPDLESLGRRAEQRPPWRSTPIFGTIDALPIAPHWRLRVFQKCPETLYRRAWAQLAEWHRWPR